MRKHEAIARLVAAIVFVDDNDSDASESERDSEFLSDLEALSILISEPGIAFAIRQKEYREDQLLAIQAITEGDHEAAGVVIDRLKS
jgi:hypothetical protein